MLVRAERVLRDPPESAAASMRVLWELAGIVLVFGMFYGAVMGTFGGVFGDRFWQVLYSALKVPVLLLVTFVISIPSFFVLNALLGLAEDFLPAMRALITTQAGLAIILAALSPMTALWYRSSADYQSAILFNGVMFAIASVSAQILLRRHYRPLVQRNPKHRWLVRGWVVIYAFVGIQMAWILRPFVGAPNMAVQFFRDEKWGNAYVIVSRNVLDVVGALLGD